MTKKIFIVLTPMMITAIFLTACAQPMPTANPTDKLQPSDASIKVSITAPTAILNTYGQEFEIGATQVSSMDGMTMIYVPAGDFLMGSLKGEGLDNEYPQHNVYLDAFWIDQTEVTNAMFSIYVNDTSYQTDVEKAGKSWIFTGSEWVEVSGADWQHPQGSGSSLTDLNDHPVVYVSWNDAHAYCEWAGRRLPTEAQWEKAARGTDGRTYPWGNEPPAGNLVNFADSNLDLDGQPFNDHYLLTAPVGSYPDGKSPYGALEMAGNTWEWAADWYDRRYYSQNIMNNPIGPENGDIRVLRGGSWHSFTNVVRAALRYRDNPSAALNDYGFRCALSQ